MQVAGANKIVRQGAQASAIGAAINSKPEAQPSESTTPDAGGIPVGVIVMWSGLLADIPDGWALCDGTGGTPDLRSRFILGWAAGVDPGATGGHTSHRHDPGTLAPVAITAGTPAGTISSVSAGTPAGTIDNHTTDLAVLSAGSTVLTGPTTHTFTGSALSGHSHTFTGSALGTHTHTMSGQTDVGNFGGSTAAEDLYPPFFKLAFIIKT
jgi:hypothetical protein